ncbi:MAG: hypothetical protein B6244_04885 [Candidatus Cloacimonetes bacterium 4572_55]|nr:MAG: hypothetical protein B6244_04885 [Candidatus Cloacimonetes bacterium 4572_55]
MKSILLWIYRLAVIPTTLIAMVILGMWGYVLSFFDKSGDKTMDFSARPFGNFVLMILAKPIEIKGLERLDPDGVYIFMPNHTSFLDIPIAVSKFPYNVRVIAKDLFFRIPFFGLAMTHSRNLRMHRDNPRKDLKTLSNGRALLKEGKSIVVFPEGSRTRTGRLQPLKTALFTLAIRSGAAVVPVAIKGAYESLPPDSIRLVHHPISMEYLDPIDSTQYSIKERGKFADHVFQVLKNHLEKDQEPLKTNQ